MKLEMPSKRGVARKSFARRRIRRVRKYDHNVLPLRMKLYMPYMAPLIEDELADSVGLEPFVEAELIIKGVPTDQWQYYEGYAKRMLRLYRNFTSETLQSEKESLIEEYVLRGYDRDVLEQEQDVVEEYVGVLWELEFSPYPIDDDTNIVTPDIDLAFDKTARFLFLITSRFQSFVHLKFFVKPLNSNVAFDFDVAFEWERVGALGSQTWNDTTSTYNLVGGRINEVSIPLTAVESDPNPPEPGTVVAVYIKNKEAANPLLVQRCSLRVMDGS